MSKSPDTEIDLSICDKEPIHLLGKVQSHGHLLVFSGSSLNLRFFSEGAEKQLGISKSQFQKLNLNLLLKLTNAGQELAKIDSLKFGNEKHVFSGFLNGILYNFTASKHQGHLNVEFEMADGLDKHSIQVSQNFLFLQRLATGLRTIKEEQQLWSYAADAFRKYTGYDRVMVYKFDLDGNGEVIAESKIFGLDTFLGLKYPASDIPKQARKLYEKNILRIIGDVDDNGKEIQSIGKEGASGLLDLSFVGLRSVSPTHLQYLKNMGVKATLGLSILEQGCLWGMVIAHHYTEPKIPDFSIRLSSEVFGEMITHRYLGLKSQKRLEIEKEFQETLESFRSSSNSVVEGLQKFSPKIFSYLGVCGAWWVSKQEIFTFGHCPSPSMDLLKKLAAVCNEDLISYHHDLPRKGFLDQELNNCAGVACLKLSKDYKNGFLLFRKEENQTVHWAGNPEKAIIPNKEDPKKLSPRNSFALWEERVKGFSQPWQMKEKELASRLRHALIDLWISTSQKEEEPSALHRNIPWGQIINDQRATLAEKEKTITNLKRGIKEAKSRSLERARFVATMSHELKTPLNGIMGLSQLVEDEGDPKSREYAHMILNASNRLLDTIQRILEYLRMEEYAPAESPEATDMSILLDRVLEPIRVLAQKKNHLLIVNVHTGHRSFWLDQTMTSAILSNLISNAIKYTPKEGRIEVNVKTGVEHQKEVLILSVEDNGIGIPLKDQSRIFDPFYSLGDITHQSDQSSGLGLFLVKRFVEHLGGTVHLESYPGKGSLFTIKLPIHSDAL